jgi:hypothetical protein
MFEDYGPTPRICIDFVINPDSLVEYKNLFDKMSHEVSLEKFMDIATNKELLDLDDASLTICLISRDTRNLVQLIMDFPISIQIKFRESLRRSWTY